MDVHRLAVENGGLANGAPAERRTLEGDVDWPIVRGVAYAIAFQQEDHGVVRLAHQGRVSGDGVEHGLQLARRAADDTQDLTRRRLLLDGRTPRTPQLFILGAQLRVRRVSDDGGTKWFPARDRKSTRLNS